MLHIRKTLMATAIATALVPATASGAGFGLLQHSAKTGGTAYAGTAVTSSDPATVFFNPAGMTRNEGSAVAGVLSYVSPEFDFEGVRRDRDGGGNVVQVEEGAGKTNESGTPIALHYMTQFRDDWAFGISINTPFGSRTQYDDDWVGRYHGIESNILAININPNLAYQINERLSVGFGVNAQYFDATLSSKAPEQGALPNSNTDSEVEIEGDSWAAGVNAGVLFDATENTQLGFAWRSQIKHNISNGDLSFTAPDGSTIAEAPGTASIELPESFTLSMKHTPGFEDRLTVLADAAYTRWSRVDTVSVQPQGELGSPFGPGGPLNEEQLSAVLDFQDSWRGSIGATWDQTERLQLRTGFQFDQSAVKDSERRTVRVPDNHRRWLSVGAGYQFANGLELDGSYSRLFISDTKINNTNTNGQTIEGEFDSSADIFTVQLTYRY